MANDSSNPDPHRRQPSNLLRVDLYKHLLPRIQEEDQASGAHGFILNWDDPSAQWDSGDPNQSWDALGFRPVVQSLFYVVETMEGEELATIESLDDLVDPYRAPPELLPIIAASFGYDLEETIPEDTQRQVVSGIIDAYKARGQFASFKVFYRMAGFRLIRVYPLWKKRVFEADNDYSRERYATSGVSESIGPAGNTAYAGRLSQPPIKPGTLRITDGSFVMRDDHPHTGVVGPPEAVLIGPNGETGTIDYQTGQYTIQLPVVSAGAVSADYERVDEEWPYHAARIDVEILLNPGGDLVTPVPLVDEEVVRNIVGRLEEVRPVHVVLRALTLVAELHDTFGPGATDQQACTTKLKDVRPGSPHLGVPGVDSTSILDSVPDIASDAAHIDQVVAGILTDRRYMFEERAHLACPLDILTIDGPPGGPFYA